LQQRASSKAEFLKASHLSARPNQLTDFGDLTSTQCRDWKKLTHFAAHS
jgi:hypothetical protein